MMMPTHISRLLTMIHCSYQRRNNDCCTNDRAHVASITYYLSLCIYYESTTRIIVQFIAFITAF